MPKKLTQAQNIRCSNNPLSNLDFKKNKTIKKHIIKSGYIFFNIKPTDFFRLSGINDP